MPPPAATSRGEIRRASVTAGVSLLLVGVFGALGFLVGIDPLVVEDDASETAANIADSESAFRIAIASLIVVASLDVVVAWALFKVFEPVSAGLSMLAAWFRAVYAGVFMVAIAQLVGVLRLLPESGQSSAEVLSGVHAYDDIWTAGLVLFGIHLVILGVLVWRAAYAPTILGILLAIAGLGYVVDGFGHALFAGYGADVAAYAFVGEVILIFWLLIRGRRLDVGEPASGPEPSLP